MPRYIQTGRIRGGLPSLATVTHLCFNSYRLPAGRWSSIRIEGDYKGTSLYVDGKLQERLEGRTMRVYNPKYKSMDEMRYQETLVFPLQQIGDTLNGFQGKLKDVSCRQGEM